MRRIYCSPPPRDGFVYFFETIGQPDLFKIGFATNVERRLATIQTACPFQLRIACDVRGTMEDERRLHRALAAHRLHGEWFDGDKTRPWMWAVLETESTDLDIIRSRIASNQAETDAFCERVNSLVRERKSA